MDMDMEEVQFSCLQSSDRILIHTDNNVYEFSITDPASHAGILKGGVLGETTVVASLLGCTPDRRRGEPLLKLKVGARALFLCASTRGVRRLVTSQVRKLSYTRENQAESTIAVA
jgi:hypothetical protein